MTDTHRALHVSLWTMLAIALAAGAARARADCPPDPPPPDCDNNGMFAGGRWELSGLSGTYTLAGDEVFYPDIFFPDWQDDFHTSGTLTVTMGGGPTENWLEVGCDGTVTGQLKETISGTVEKIADISYYDPVTCPYQPEDMLWNLTIERTVAVTGSVTGTGQLDLELSVDTATLDFNGSLTFGVDCVDFHGTDSFQDFDLSGDVEEIRMAGGYDPVGWRYEPTITPLGATTWLDEILHRVALNGGHQGTDDTVFVNPTLDPPNSTQPPIQSHNLYLIQHSVTVTAEYLEAQAEPKVPAVTSLELQEPAQYLADVSVTTRVVATVDWRGLTPGTVEFTYGGTTETVPGADTVTWDFDAGQPGTTIQAVAEAGGERSLPYVVNTPKVPVPGWAGSASDWSGSPGVSYRATLDWPVSLETTRTLDTISLFTGPWGISGSASSELNAAASSSGSPAAGDMTTQAEFRFAGRSGAFHMEGPNETVLACDGLTTTGSASASTSGGSWQKTINPLTLIPGLEPAVCGLSGFLCGVVNSAGVKGSASASVTGTATYTGAGPEILWDGGSVGGSLSGKIAFGASVPPPLSSVAGFEIYGSATGCLEFMVAPSLELTAVGGHFDVEASAWFFGLAAGVDEDFPFGDACAKQTPDAAAASSSGWVPADGQLAMAAERAGGVQTGIAVWTETPSGQVRPSGDIWYRIETGGVWGPGIRLTDDADSDVAPAVDFDAAGRAVIVYQRSTVPLPVVPADLPAFADGYELHWAAIDPSTGLTVGGGQLTANGSNDFGPRLRRDAAGGLHVFWQRASGVELAGTAADPVSILAASWDASSGTWSGESVAASGLESTFGWSPAAHSADDMLVGLVVDVDGDFATADDREVFQISRSSGSWALPVQVTSNLVADDSVLAAFEPAGEPVLLWRRDGQAWQLRGDLHGPPGAAFTSADPSVDDGISAALGAGTIAAGTDGVSVLWTEGLAASLTRESAAPQGWEAPTSPFATGDSESVHFLRWLDGRLVAGYAVRSFQNGADLAPTVEPRFAELLNPEVFRDGFESGDTGLWSVAVP